jgi:flagellin
VASADTGGQLVLTASSGLDISIGGTSASDILGTAATNVTHGTISLVSDTGADVKISGNNEAVAGFTEQGGSSEAVGSGLNVMTMQNANNAIDRIDDAIDKVSENRAELGAVQNRLDSTISNLQNASENFSAANGRLMDADFAKETADMSKQQILMQAGVAMLAQAKQLPQQVLQLLQA